MPGVAVGLRRVLGRDLLGGDEAESGWQRGFGQVAQLAPVELGPEAVVARGLLDGAMDLAIVTDYDDEDAYRRWLAHPEHARVRAELLAPLIGRRERCQIRI